MARSKGAANEAPAPQELPVELEGIEGRKKLIEGLKAIDTKTSPRLYVHCLHRIAPSRRHSA